MYKKIIILYCITFLTVAFSNGCNCGCGCNDHKDGNDNPDIVLLNKMSRINDDYNAEIKKANNADDIVIAIDRYINSINELSGPMQDFYQKYPGIKSGNDIPVELQESLGKLIKAQKNSMGSYMKIGKFMETSQEVRDAYKRYADALKKND